MNTYQITLERRKNGAACGTVTETTDADTILEAENSVVEMWRELDPRFTYAPLLTIQISSTNA